MESMPLLFVLIITEENAADCFVVGKAGLCAMSLLEKYNIGCLQVGVALYYEEKEERERRFFRDCS